MPARSGIGAQAPKDTYELAWALARDRYERTRRGWEVGRENSSHTNRLSVALLINVTDFAAGLAGARAIIGEFTIADYKCW